MLTVSAPKSKAFWSPIRLNDAYILWCLCRLKMIIKNDAYADINGSLYLFEILKTVVRSTSILLLWWMYYISSILNYGLSLPKHVQTDMQQT